MLELTVLLLVFLFVAPNNVFAYLDPGTGSYLTQIVIGSLLGGIYVGKRYFVKIISFFKNAKKKDAEDDKEAKS